jgi:hypothetical protein
MPPVDKQQSWLQVAAIVIALIAHGSVVAFKLGELTQLVSGNNDEIHLLRTAINDQSLILSDHLIGHPDGKLQSEIDLLTQKVESYHR